MMKACQAVLSVVLWVAGAAAVSAAEPPSADRLNASEEKLLGAWIGDSGCAGDLVFQADRTYHHVDFGPGGGMFEVGSWRVEADELPPTLVLTPLPTEATEPDDRAETRFRIVKVNDDELFFRWSKFADSTIYEHRRGTATDDVAIRIAILDHAVQRYLGNDDHGAGVNLPASLGTLVETNVLPTSKSLLDPWGRQFHYDIAGRKTGNKQVPDVWTETPDGKTIGNWSLRDPPRR